MTRVETKVAIEIQCFKKTQLCNNKSAIGWGDGYVIVGVCASARNSSYMAYIS